MISLLVGPSSEMVFASMSTLAILPDICFAFGLVTAVGGLLVVAVESVCAWPCETASVKEAKIIKQTLVTFIILMVIECVQLFDRQ